MIGITAFGGYIPRLRLDRASVFAHMGWHAPATLLLAEGERAVGNWDEDSLTMAVAACRDCLTGRDRTALGGLYLGSTTLPFADRLNAGIVKEALNLADTVSAYDLTGSQRAGTGALLSALTAVKAGQVHAALVAAADRRETRAGGSYELWFGDGAAALEVGDGEVLAELLGSFTLTRDLVDHYRGAQHRFDYTWEERWVRDVGYARLIPEAIQGVCAEAGLTVETVDHWVYPCYFGAEHRAIAKRLGLPAGTVVDNLHAVCGETGAAHPLVMLVSALEQAEPGAVVVVVGFGQGVDALAFRVTERIRDLKPRRGVRGWLQRRKPEATYTKFLKFRDLLETDSGIRAEAPTQTALTTLWRQRKMLLGLVGGRCRACGTPQFPAMDICVNPDCRALASQDDHAFADVPAEVMTYTGDLLAVTPDPPAIYGMVQFAGGGRLLADFTDCELTDIRVGQPVTMVFRKRYTDKQRGFVGYFWKAVPAAPEP